MRTIIGGLSYDTATADDLGEYWGDVNKRSSGYWKAGLYRTPKGRFFLEGEGHANSPFAQRFPHGMRGGGEGLVPIDAEVALAIVSETASADFVKQWFGDMIGEASPIAPSARHPSGGGRAEAGACWFRRAGQTGRVSTGPADGTAGRGGTRSSTSPAIVPRATREAFVWLPSTGSRRYRDGHLEERHPGRFGRLGGGGSGADRPGNEFPDRRS